MSQKGIMLRESLKACETMIRAYHDYIRTHPLDFQPNNAYYKALREEYARIQEQVIDEDIREFVYGDEENESIGSL